MNWSMFRDRPKRREIWSDEDWDKTSYIEEAYWMQCQECDYFGPDHPFLHLLCDPIIPWKR